MNADRRLLLWHPFRAEVVRRGAPESGSSLALSAGSGRRNTNNSTFSKNRQLTRWSKKGLRATCGVG